MSDGERRGVAVLGVQPLVLTRGEGARLITAIAREFNWPVKIEGDHVILGVCWDAEAKRLLVDPPTPDAAAVRQHWPSPDWRYGAVDAEFPLGAAT